MQTKESLFGQYLALLQKWNKTYNLTSLTDAAEIRIKHFEDSLALLPHLPASGRLLDIGTGAGFPGVPLKIGRPELEICLLDSREKKIRFCNAVIRELGLKGISAVKGRVEDKETQECLGQFDAVVSRATFKPDFLWGIAPNFLRPGGIFIAMIGPNEPLSRFKWNLPGSCQVIEYELSGGYGRRKLAICFT